MVIVLAAIIGHHFTVHKHPKKEVEKIKKLLFITIVIVTAFASLHIVYPTVWSNMNSWTKGPVHWHADMEVWKCDEELNILDPTNLVNRIGSSLFHEHDDKRLHIEGVVMDSNDIVLSKFFEAIGGSLTKKQLTLTLNEGVVSLKDDDVCLGERAELQGFVYKVINPDEKPWKIMQEKIKDLSAYVVSPQPNVPPGDCLIIELSKSKEKTEKLCRTYKVAIEKGDMIGS